MPQDIPAAMSEETRSKFSELIQQNMDYGKFVQTDFTMENFYDELKKKDLEVFALKKQLEDARMSRDIYKKQVYNVTESRMTWKSKYEPIEYQHRQTVLDPEQTLLFMLLFCILIRPS
uniref:Uncharacterized protein n=1 Tax=Acrobeloides nanus TaxID=290746 RepID=A0A914DTJ6_9BILA